MKLTTLKQKNKRPLSIRAKLFDHMLHSWWVVLFVLVSTLSLHASIKHLDLQEEQLRFQLERLGHSKNLIIQYQKDLELQIESQNDPAWIEMVLRDELGLVSEGQTRVQFVKN